MNEKELIISRFLDAKKNCFENSVVTHTSFLTLEERELVRPLAKEFGESVDTFFYGGYEDAERTVAVFLPSFFGAETAEEFFSSCPDENPLKVIEIKKDRFSSLSHRDYLGSLMGLGIKREMLGDIKVTDDGAYVFALESICRYITENLTKAGRGTVKAKAKKVCDLPETEEKTETSFSSVASLRLDNVLSAAFNLSRSTAVEAIKSGLVFVNSVQSFKSDMTLKEKDKIVLRGKGKAVLEEIIGESKKGRIHINIKKFK